VLVLFGVDMFIPAWQPADAGNAEPIESTAPSWLRLRISTTRRADFNKKLQIYR